MNVTMARNMELKKFWSRSEKQSPILKMGTVSNRIEILYSPFFNAKNDTSTLVFHYDSQKYPLEPPPPFKGGFYRVEFLYTPVF